MPGSPKPPRKIEYLLDKFLIFASKEAQFNQYLQSVHTELCGAEPAAPQMNAVPPSRMRTVSPSDNRTMGPGPARQPAQAPKTQPIPPPVVQECPDITRIVADIRAVYAMDQDELARLITAEKDANTKAVLLKRSEVLKRRNDFLDKIEKMLINLAHQMQLLEDTLGLINDEIRARSPEQILEDINDVISQTDSMTQVLEEMAPYEQMVSRIEMTS